MLFKLFSAYAVSIAISIVFTTQCDSRCEAAAATNAEELSLDNDAASAVEEATNGTTLIGNSDGELSNTSSFLNVTLNGTSTVENAEDSEGNVAGILRNETIDGGLNTSQVSGIDEVSSNTPAENASVAFEDLSQTEAVASADASSDHGTSVVPGEDTDAIGATENGTSGTLTVSALDYDDTENSSILSVSNGTVLDDQPNVVPNELNNAATSVPGETTLNSDSNFMPSEHLAKASNPVAPGVVQNYPQLGVVTSGAVLAAAAAAAGVSNTIPNYVMYAAQPSAGYYPGSSAGYYPGVSAGYYPGVSAGYYPGGSAGYYPGGSAGYYPAGSAGYYPAGSAGYYSAGSAGYYPGGSSGYYPGGSSAIPSYYVVYPVAPAAGGAAAAAVPNYIPSNNGVLPQAMGSSGFLNVLPSNVAASGYPSSAAPAAYYSMMPYSIPNTQPPPPLPLANAIVRLQSDAAATEVTVQSGWNAEIDDGTTTSYTDEANDTWSSEDATSTTSSIDSNGTGETAVSKTANNVIVESTSSVNNVTAKKVKKEGTAMLIWKYGKEACKNLWKIAVYLAQKRLSFGGGMGAGGPGGFGAGGGYGGGMGGGFGGGGGYDNYGNNNNNNNFGANNNNY